VYIVGQHDGHLPFWLPAFAKFIYLLYCYVFAVVANYGALGHVHLLDIQQFHF